MSPLLFSLGLSLGLTLLFELGFALAWGVRGRGLLFVALANLLTNPAVVLAAAAGAPVWLLEVLAVLVEALVYRRSGVTARPLLFSLCANALSFGLGLVLQLVL